MTTLDWLCGHLNTMFTKDGKSHSYLHGLVSHPTYYSGVGHRDKVYKSPSRFDYKLWNTLVFNAEDSSPFCRNKMAVKYTFYPCYASNLTRDRLNMIARILNIPIHFSVDDDNMYADDMMCDYIFVYPEMHEIIYHVHGYNPETYEAMDYLVIKLYDKKGVRWAW